MIINNHQVHTDEIWTKALNLEGSHYKELPVVGEYSKATTLIQNEEKKHFWFVDDNNIDHHINLLKSIN